MFKYRKDPNNEIWHAELDSYLARIVRDPQGRFVWVFSGPTGKVVCGFEFDLAAAKASVQGALAKVQNK